MSYLKKILVSCGLILGSIFMDGCNSTINSVESTLQEAQIILVDKKDFILMNEEDDHFILIGSLNRPNKDKNLWYYTNKVFEDENFWYLKTSTDHSMNVWLEKISKKDLKVEQVKYPGIDINVMTFDENQLITSRNRGQKLIFYFFDLDLSLQTEKILDYRVEETEMIFEVQLSPSETGFNLLVGFKPINTPYEYNENHLLQLDKEFNIINDINLEFYDGSLSSFQEVENKLFVSVSTQGIGNDGQGIPANKLFVYDINNNYSLIDQINLSQNSHGKLLYDDLTGKLILDRTELDERNLNIPFLIIDPSTYEVTEIFLPQNIEIPNDGHFPYIQVKNGKLYLLIKDYLLIWNLESLNCIVQPLSGVAEDGLGLLLL